MFRPAPLAAWFAPRLAALLLLLASPVAAAQPAPALITDRPDFTESPLTVPAGHVQAEGGATWSRSAGVGALSGAELLVRWAPVPRAELRFGAPDYVVADGASGFASPSLGVKVALGEAAGWAVGAIATATLPVGAAAFASEDVEPELIVTAGRAVGALSLGAQLAGTWADGALASGATVVLSAGLTERLGAFVEAALADDAGGTALVLHHGYTWALGPLAQLDLHGGVGLTEAAPDVFVGAGFAIRW